MDALSGYGSDDSEDDALLHTSALSALVAYDDDDDEDDTEEVHKRPPPKKLKLSEPTPNPTIVSVASSSKMLPPPPLGNHSLITSEVDHFSLNYGSQPLDSAIPVPLKLQQLQLQRSSRSTKTTLNNNNTANTTAKFSWAEEIKSQHDFCNPALFETAVQNFGICNVLGSNITCQETVMEDYEFDLVRLEEEARIRQQQQHVAIASPTPFAQEQLERAMQIHRRL